MCIWGVTVAYLSDDEYESVWLFRQKQDLFIELSKVTCIELLH